VKRIILAAILGILAAGLLSSGRSTSSSNADNDYEEAQQAYGAYVRAWKLRDLTALRNLISDDYMAVNSEGTVSDRENEISTAKADPEWLAITVDEIHTRIFGNAAVASGFISAEGKRPHGDVFKAKVRFLATLVKLNGVWQLVATQSTAFRPDSSQQPACNDVRRP
jgi:predicted lipid-binding transport protein (Tim44 family)